MAEQSNTYTDPDSLDALTADKQRFWNGFTTATTASVIVAALILIAMALFL
jgi:hypothetical protein